MIVEISIEDESSFKIENCLFDSLAMRIEKQESLSPQKRVFVNLCSEQTITELNKKYRFCERSTDVLAFGSDFSYSSFLGDIFINYDDIKNRTGQHHKNRTLKKLFVHGTLHLIGYDHFSSVQRQEMQKRERYYEQFL